MKAEIQSAEGTFTSSSSMLPETLVKSTNAEYQRKWRLAHLDKVRLYAREWCSNNRKRVRNYANNWRLKNRDKILVKKRESYHSNPEPTKERRKQYYYRIEVPKRNLAMKRSLANIKLTKGICKYIPNRKNHLVYWTANITICGKKQREYFSILKYGQDGARLMATLQRFLWLIKYNIWNPKDGDPLATLFSSELFNGNAEYAENEQGGKSVVDYREIPSPYIKKRQSKDDY